MKSLRLATLLLSTMVLAVSCDDRMQAECEDAVLATVKDLSGLDGCGFLFELADGTRLEPQRLFFCGTPPLPKEVTEDPLYNFEFVEGKQVRIGFVEVTDAVSICMAGRIVKITCIEEITPGE
jgi:hypothetical protein